MNEKSYKKHKEQLTVDAGYLAKYGRSDWRPATYFKGDKEEYVGKMAEQYREGIEELKATKGDLDNEHDYLNNKLVGMEKKLEEQIEELKKEFYQKNAHILMAIDSIGIENSIIYEASKRESKQARIDAYIKACKSEFGKWIVHTYSDDTTFYYETEVYTVQILLERPWGRYSNWEVRYEFRYNGKASHKSNMIKTLDKKAKFKNKEDALKYIEGRKTYFVNQINKGGGK